MTVLVLESMECCCPSVDGITRITPQTLAIQYQNLEKTKKLIASESSLCHLLARLLCSSIGQNQLVVIDNTGAYARK